MSKKGLLIMIAIWLASSGSIGFIAYRIESHRVNVRNEFIGRWNASGQRWRTENQKLISLVKDLNHLIDTSGIPKQEFAPARVTAKASDEALYYANECFAKIKNRFYKKSSIDLEYENDLLVLTEGPLKNAEALNEDLKQEIQDLKNAESPK